MQQIDSPIYIVQKILGEQKAKEGTLYRLNTHCMCMERPEGVLLYHTLTGELLLLSHEEAALLGKLPGPVPSTLMELVSRWFLRPQGADDMALADQARQIAERFEEKKAVLTGYTIFTTTDCNARCFYCYEAGWKKSSMTEQTALATARYIAEHCGGRLVRIKWFGGEPLVNVRVIDIITDYLRQHGVEFRSTMTSNGYLFDEDMVRRAKADWNLQVVQITLDGTEKVYNQRKAYVNPHGSPYQRVLRNIGLLLNADIHVEVRLNMDKDNEQDLYALLDELAERFGGTPGFGVYLMLIKDTSGTAPTSHLEDAQRSSAKKIQSMRTYVEEKGMTALIPLKRGFTVSSCLADSDKSTTVMPDGRLGRCESICEKGLWGSVFSEERDEGVLRQWKERKPPEAICKACSIYPQCIRLKICPDWREHCYPTKRAQREDTIRRAVLGAYENHKTAGQN